MSPFTTDLETIRTNPERFTWGKVEAIVDCAYYTFVQFETEERTLVHVYVDGKDTCRSAGSLEEAFVVAVAYRNGHRNDGASHNAWKLLKREGAF